MRYLLKRKQNGCLLDIGCGLGFFLKNAEKYYSCYGIDVSDYAIACAETRIRHASLSTGSADSLNFNDDSFDIITSFDVLEHLADPGHAITEFYRTLKDDGLLIISVPNTESIGLQWKGKRWHGFRDPTHISILSPIEWQKLLENYKFSTIDIRYDGRWDTPFFDRVPKGVQYMIFNIPSMLLFWLGVRIPRKYGDNIIFVVQKSNQ